MPTVNSAIQSANTLAADVKDAIDRAPSALGQAGAQLETLARNGLDRARELGTNVRDRAAQTGDRTVAYIHEQPVKAVLIAAAAGAALTLLASALTRNRGN